MLTGHHSSGDTVVSNAGMFWMPLNIKFYPCHRCTKELCGFLLMLAWDDGYIVPLWVWPLNSMRVVDLEDVYCVK